MNLLAVVLGALCFLWPAILNGYPLVFSDTGGFLNQALGPDTGWDKPWIYGPFLTPFHACLTLWPAAFGQCLILSAALWLTQVTLGCPNRVRHVVVCIILAAGTAASWFASQLMPDIFAPITVLGLFILAYRPAQLGPATVAAVTLVTAVAIASHLAHLILAAACIGTLALLRWRILWRPAIPLAGALLLLVLANTVAFDRLAISPYGSVFALARLVADGPAREYLRTTCPTRDAPRLCAWQDRLPIDSDAFLWEPHGVMWGGEFGPTLLAPEASSIVAATIRTHPVAVLIAALRNTARQLAMVRVGDSLVPDHLDVTIGKRIGQFFPPAELSRYDAALQPRGELNARAATVAPLHLVLLLLGAVGTATLTNGLRRGHHPLAVFAALVLVALLANAFSTGALSGPHDRYQARIAWLVLLPPLLWISRAPARRPGPLPLLPANARSSVG